MLSTFLPPILMTFILLQFNQKFAAPNLDQSADTDIVPIRHSRSRVHRHLYDLMSLATVANESLDNANAKLPANNYVNEFYHNTFTPTTTSLPTPSSSAAATATSAAVNVAGMQNQTTLASVTHKIRKLHKKQLVENMRKNVHHRSLIQAEQLQGNLLIATEHNYNNNKNVQNYKTNKLVVEDQNDEYLESMFPKTTATVGQEITVKLTAEPTANATQSLNTTKTKTAITKLYRVDTIHDDYQKLSLAEGTTTAMAKDADDLKSISADSKDLSGMSTVLERKQSISLLMPEYDSKTSEEDLDTYASPQSIKPNDNVNVNGNFTGDLLWNENETFAPSIFASTSLSGERQHASLLSNNLQENSLKSISLTEKNEEIALDDALIDNRHASGFPIESEDSNLMSVAAGDDEESLETNQLLEGVIDAANEDEIYDWDEISRNNRRNLMRGRDVVTKFLQIVETQHSLGSNCEAGTSLNLGEGVVDRYAQDRFRVEAEVAVNRANMLTRIFKMTAPAVQADVNLLHASVLSMVEFDDDIFAAGNCFDWNEHPSQVGLFCPFAYRLPPPQLGAIIAKDLANEYHYLGNTSEWFFQARKNAEKVIAINEQYLKAFHLYSNNTEERIEDDTLAVKYEDGRWSKPYYDCGGGNIWMLTYTVPFFGYENGTYHFKGTSGIDIDLRRVDIDQCPQRNTPGSTQPLNIFAGTDKCKQRTTMCQAIKGLGFRRGSYKCICRKGYFFPDITTMVRYFNGSLLEEEYEKLMLGKNSSYSISNEYECLPCAEGCDSCEDSSPCIAALNWPMRTSILVLACTVIGLLPPAAWFTFRYQQVKVVRAASPALLRVIALGAFFIYCTNIVMYPNPNLYSCTARIWLREIGFSLTYGALMLKTWRISVIFRVRSAKAVKITDAALLKRLGIICGVIGTCLLVRTLVAPPDVVVGRTANDLKAFLCKTDWWDYTFTTMEVLFLAWGVRLCIMVRKAPSEFNESRFISMAIYNEFLLTCFLNVSMFFLQSPANPDLLYIIFFCHTQLTITLLLCLIFGSKVYIVLRSGKSHQETVGMGAKPAGAKFNFRPQVRTFANPSTLSTNAMPALGTGTSAEKKLSDQEALEEIRQLSFRLQRIQEMAPPKGVAVMTISSLLDGLRTPGSMMLVAAAAAQPSNSTNAQPLPLLADMQKYQTTRQISGTQQTIMAAKSICTDCAVNTDISGLAGNSAAQAGYVICSRCLQLSKDMLQMATCQELGSPQTEGSISFSKLKLDCMCSHSEDLHQYVTEKHLSEDEISQQPRRRQMRSAATNTPPLGAGSNYQCCSNCQTQNSSRSLQTNAQQICDNCKKKYRSNTSNNNNNNNSNNINNNNNSSCSSAQRKQRKTHKRLIASSVFSNKRHKSINKDASAATTTTITRKETKAATTMTHSNDDIIFCSSAASCSLSSSAASAEHSLCSSECHITSKQRFTQSETVLNAQCIGMTRAASASQSVSSSALTAAVELDASAANELEDDNKTNGKNGATMRKKRPDKLMLDLNDRTKYTKEVSV